ncbi:DNA-binding transcriptional LysR family regulator [Brevundimonas sp. 1080]|uniref:LysR family transcriptional regulator n=1 Tax=Brevundimonas sp. 1080 TaxID=3156405 RepID=UPI00339A2150
MRSAAVGKLERTLGVRLFNRTTRSVSLTEAGQQFVAQVAPALHEIHEAMTVARSLQATPSGRLRINAFPTAAREIFSALVLQFVREPPKAKSMSLPRAGWWTSSRADSISTSAAPTASQST